MRLLPIFLLLGAAACNRKPTQVQTAEKPSEPVPRTIAHTIDRGDGWLVEITQAGSGREARIGDEVAVVYDAHVKDAEETIASTRSWTTPCRFHIGSTETIPGLSRGLEGIRAGSKVTIEVPPALGYGAQGCPASN